MDFWSFISFLIAISSVSENVVAITAAGGSTSAPPTTPVPTGAAVGTATAVTTEAMTDTTATAGTTIVTTKATTGTTAAGGTTIVTTEVTAATTEAAGNATGSTAAGTTNAATTAPNLKDIIPSFQVNNSRDEACMLLVFKATLKVQYETHHNGTQEAAIPMTMTSAVEGSCDQNRTIWFNYPNKTYCAALVLWFNVTSNTTYVNREGVSLHYVEPCFSPDAVQYGIYRPGSFRGTTYEGTIGKSLQCKSLTRSQHGVTLLMEDVVFQPFADESSDKGHFGEVETCPETVPTTASRASTPSTTTLLPTKASPNNGGMIAGIVLATLAVMAIIVGVGVYVVKKRKQREVPYGGLD